MTDQLINTLVMPAGHAAGAAGPLADRPGEPPPIGAAGAGRPGHEPASQSSASTMRSQLQPTPQPVDTQPDVTAPATVMLEGGIFAARASPDITSFNAAGIAPGLAEPAIAGDTLPGKSLPPAGNVLPGLELNSSADEVSIPGPVATDSPGEEIHEVIMVPAALPDQAMAAAMAGSQQPADNTPVNPIWKIATGTLPGDSTAAVSQPDQTIMIPPGTGRQSTDPDSGSHRQSYRTVETVLMSNTNGDDAPIAKTAQFTIPADSAVSPISYTNSSATGQGNLNELTELPQMQSFRPLQPTMDPELFNSGLGNRLMLMSREGVQSARLKLHPEHLGPLDVRIQVEDDTARVWFGAQHGQTREALEAAIPRLRELFADQGMQLVRADVTSGEERRQTDDGFLNQANTGAATSNDRPADLADSFIPSISQVSDRLLDIYV